MSIFLGWSGACGGAACSVSLDGDKQAAAYFGVLGANLWLAQLGDTAQDFGSAIAVDGAGDVVAVGTFQGSVVLGGITLMSAGGRDVFIVKFSGLSGDVLWAKRLGGTGNDEGTAVTLAHGTDDVLIAGSFEGMVNLGGGMVTSAGGTDVFLARFSSATGAHLWSERLGGTAADSPRAVTIDPDDDVFLTGIFSGAVDLGGGLLMSGGGVDVFLGKFSGSDGAHLWSEAFGGAGTEASTGLVADSAGNVVVVGYFASANVNFGGLDFSANGTGDAFIAKYAADTGAHLFSQTYGASGFDSANGLTVDAVGGLFVVGRFEGTVNFGGGTPLVATTGDDIFLLKLTLAGSHLWSKSFGGTASEIGHDVVVDTGGDAIVAGTFQGSIDLGGGLLSSAGNLDIFVARLAGGDGAHVASRRLGGTGGEQSPNVSLGAFGQIYMTGSFTGFAEFGVDTLMSAGMLSDVFFLGLASL